MCLDILGATPELRAAVPTSLVLARVIISQRDQYRLISETGELEAEAQIAVSSGKALVEAQPALFAEMDEDKWRSTASVSPKNQHPNSSVR